MPKPWLMRRLVNGMPCMLVAALLLVSRLVAPSMAMPLADPVGLALQTICHTESPGQPAPADHSDHRDCLLCPACHLAAHAVLPSPAAPGVPPPPVRTTSAGAPLPPATGPPTRFRATAQPTGPPARSA